ncbi:hypothetical protein [Scytonema hofmannii]|uniref:hypothetical protein n=1 Tax=Scytonema hofmannii TaxID=34078 RepID=UPI00034CE64E
MPLYHPRKDLWREHFEFKGAEIFPLTTKGRVTIRLLQLNRRDRVEERQFLLQSGMYTANSE